MMMKFKMDRQMAVTCMGILAAAAIMIAAGYMMAGEADHMHKQYLNERDAVLNNILERLHEVEKAQAEQEKIDEYHGRLFANLLNRTAALETDVYDLKVKQDVRSILAEQGLVAIPKP